MSATHLPVRPGPLPVRPGPLPVVHALAVSAGYFKGSPLLAWVPVDLTVLACAVLVAATVLDVVARGPRNRVPVWLLVVLVALVPGAVVPVPVGYHAEKLAALVLTVVVVVSARQLLGDPERRRAWLGATTAFAALTVGALLLTPDDSTYGRAALEGSTTIAAGRVSGLVVLVGTVWCLTPGASHRPFRWAATLAGVVVAAGVLVSSGSRGPFAAVAVALVTTVLLAPWARRATRITVTLTALGATVVALTVSTAPGAQRLLGALVSTDAATATRQPLWAAAFRSLSDLPGALVGTGWGGFVSRLGPDELPLDAGPRLHPHNVVLEAFVEGGPVAGVALTAFVVASLVALWRRAGASGSSVDVVLFGVAVFLVANAWGSGDLNDNRHMWAALTLAWSVAPVTPTVDAHRPRRLTPVG